MIISKYLGPIALKLLGDKLAPKLVYNVLRKVLLNFSEMAAWFLMTIPEPDCTRSCQKDPYIEHTTIFQLGQNSSEDKPYGRNWYKELWAIELIKQTALQAINLCGTGPRH